jgi:hypothetical protein
MAAQPKIALNLSKMLERPPMAEQTKMAEPTIFFFSEFYVCLSTDLIDQVDFGNAILRVPHSLTHL